MKRGGGEGLKVGRAVNSRAEFIRRPGTARLLGQDSGAGTEKGNSCMDARQRAARSRKGRGGAGRGGRGRMQRAPGGCGRGRAGDCGPAVVEEGDAVGKDLEGEFGEVEPEEDPVHGVARRRPPLGLHGRIRKEGGVKSEGAKEVGRRGRMGRGWAERVLGAPLRCLTRNNVFPFDPLTSSNLLGLACEPDAFRM